MGQMTHLCLPSEKEMSLESWLLLIRIILDAQVLLWADSLSKASDRIEAVERGDAAA
jgi:hypothetical protein